MKIQLLFGTMLLCTQIAIADRQVTCPPSQTAPTEDQMGVVRPMMASPEHRLWHDRWHSWRGQWASFPSAERAQIAADYPSLYPPRGLGPPTDLADKTKCTSDEYNPSKNGAGEDFLYMHHNMMKMVNGRLGRSCIGGWNELPERTSYLPGQQYDNSRIEAAFPQMQEWKKIFLDESTTGPLSGKSLSEVGNALEFTLHNFMHVYYATRRAGMPNPANLPRISLVGAGLPEGSIYNSEAFDYLANPYSAHVNPMFWKLHGLIDQVIFAWMKANGHEEIDENCSGRPKCYQWKGTFEGDSPHRPAGHDQHRNHTQHQGHAPTKTPVSRGVNTAPANPFQQGVESVQRIQRDLSAVKQRGPGDNPNDPFVIARENWRGAVRECTKGTGPGRRSSGQP